MSHLIETATAKIHFPRWADFLSDQVADETPVTAEQNLDACMTRADTELMRFVPSVDAAAVTADTTHSLLMHYMAVLRYEAFLVKHGSESFETKPAIVRQYERTISALESRKVGSGHIQMSSRPRVMNRGFLPGTATGTVSDLEELGR